MIATESQRTQRFYPPAATRLPQKTRMMLCVNSYVARMKCNVLNSTGLNLVTALHPGYELSVSCYKPIEPLDARKEQDKCPQINADEHG